MLCITFVSLSKKKSMEKLNVNGCYGPVDMSVRIRSLTSLVVLAYVLATGRFT